GSGQKSVLYDGYEFSYSYHTPEQFGNRRRVIREKELGWTGVADLMRQRWRAGFGIWIDYDQKSDPADFTKNFFTPDEFAYALHEATRYTDKYVWIWSEKTSFWSGNMPKGYIEALDAARRPNVPQPPTRPSDR